MRSRIIIIFLVLCGLGCSSEKNEGGDVTIRASYTDYALTIDGRLDETVWQRAQAVTLVQNRSGEAVVDSSLRTSVRVSYSDDWLYIGFVCNDGDIWGTFTQRDEYLWTEEAVEVFLDVDDEEKNYIEIEVSPQNVLFDSYIVDPVTIDIPATAQFDMPQLTSAVAVDGTLNWGEDCDRRWVVELAVAFEDIYNNFEKIEPGETELKINFYRIDRNRNSESGSYAWSATGGRFHKPSVFGTLIFEK